MSKIKIIYSEKFDVQRVKSTISKLDWYVQNKYNYKKFPFPKSLDIEKLQSYSEEKIMNAVNIEYNEDIYKEYEKILIDFWDKVSVELKTSFLNTGLKYQDEYEIYLTKYGTGGSYNLPNIVVINTLFSSKERILQLVIHEIIHLAIEEDIIKYKIGQAQKERIVDLFFIKNFPRRIFTQNVYMSMNTEKIDQLFDDIFPDMKSLIEKISS